LGELFDRTMDETHQADARGGLLPGGSAQHLPAELADLQQRRKKLEELQRTLQAQDQTRRKEGKDPQKRPAQLPKADPEARVMPNKDGG
jgi:hypothetical protein